MKNLRLQLCVLAIVFEIALSLANPGALISIPFPLSPPYLNINLPIKIDPILVNNLQLSEILLKKVDYKWKFTETQVIVNISDARVLFQWKYKKDQGQGIFEESSYDLIFIYQIKKNNKTDRLDLEISSTKSKLGKSTVHLGGKVQQTVVVQVTLLILNHAAITFRRTIQNALKNAILSFSDILGKDLKIKCTTSRTQQISQQCLYINTTLIAPPIINNKLLVIQINAAPYITGQKSGILNPQNALIVKNQSNIQLQVSKKLLDSLIKKILLILPNNVEVNLNQISSTPDINSLTLSTFFPQMKNYPTVKDVILSIKMPQISSSFDTQSQSLQINGWSSVQVFTQEQATKMRQKYMSPCNASFTVNIKFVYGWRSTSVRLSKVTLNQFKCSQHDIDENFVRPYILTDIQNTLMTYLQGGVNGSLNEKLITLNFDNILATLKGVIYDQAIKMDINLGSVNKEGKMRVNIQEL